ncbi:hypothetical protein DERP_014675 [Dermatophagoides pteronyssinus]|uniref:Uncharacterized protein n=1 Tax=Dermatophagoides pteronyssinus TaxID=6956 RepID=A0ABQ8JS77_DERPT|nr:hypothetical protein DERP_014675 [Dermatophagoides pteronyssinus]
MDVDFETRILSPRDYGLEKKKEKKNSLFDGWMDGLWFFRDCVVQPLPLPSINEQKIQVIFPFLHVPNLLVLFTSSLNKD